jgi:hypothetical protein
MDDIAYSVALDLMVMYVHGDPDRLEHIRPQLMAAARNVGKRPKGHGSQMDAHHFEQMIGWLLKKGREDADARAVAVELATSAAGESDSVEGLLKSVLRILLSNFATIVWPVFGRAIVADRAKAWRLDHLLGDSYSFAETKSPAILCVPEDLLFAWCHANPEIGPALLAQFVPILTRQRAEEGGNKLHPTAKRLLDEFGDRDDVLKRLVQNMHTFGWTGSTTTYYALYDAPLRSFAKSSDWSRSALCQDNAEPYDDTNSGVADRGRRATSSIGHIAGAQSARHLPRSAVPANRRGFRVVRNPRNSGR